MMDAMQIMDVTPEMAAEWLKRNPMNRRIKKEHLAQMVRDMKAGYWQFNGDAIRFDVDGNLIDGQHRLHSCVRSGVAFKTLVVRGLSSTVRDTIDSGAKRSNGDRFEMQGVPNGRHVAAMINQIGTLAFHEPRRVFTPSESDAIYRRHYAQIDISVKHANRSGAVPPVWLTSLHFIGCYTGKEPLAEAFVRVFKTGIPSYPDDPAHLMRERLVRAKMAGNPMSRDWTELSYLMVTTFNNFMRGMSTKALRPTKSLEIKGWSEKDLW